MNPACITIIPPEQFNQIPWKNGLGVTTELAISEQGTVQTFDWRLSIASVSENGRFSDFSNYWRQLVLLDGHGIILHHHPQSQISLDKPLAMAQFDGGWHTEGELIAGAIRDFNIMTRKHHYTSEVHCYPEHATVNLPATELCFVYSDKHGIELTSVAKSSVNRHWQLAPRHLLKLTQLKSGQMQLNGTGMIVICINRCAENLKN